MFTTMPRSGLLPAVREILPSLQAPFGFRMISRPKLAFGLLSAESSRKCAPQQCRRPAEFGLELSSNYQSLELSD
jgi:hypothetical protein